MMTILERIMAEAKKADTTALSCEERMGGAVSLGQGQGRTGRLEREPVSV